MANGHNALQKENLTDIQTVGEYLRPEAVKAILDSYGIPATDQITDAPVFGDPNQNDGPNRKQIFKPSQTSATILKPYAIITASLDQNALGDTLRQEFAFYERNIAHLPAGIDPDAAREFYVLYNQDAHWVTAKVHVDKKINGLRSFSLEVINSLNGNTTKHPYSALEGTKGPFPLYQAVGEYQQFYTGQQSNDHGNLNSCGLRAAENTAALIGGMDIEKLPKQNEIALRKEKAAQVTNFYKNGTIASIALPTPPGKIAANLAPPIAPTTKTAVKPPVAMASKEANNKKSDVIIKDKKIPVKNIATLPTKLAIITLDWLENLFKRAPSEAATAIIFVGNLLSLAGLLFGLASKTKEALTPVDVIVENPAAAPKAGGAGAIESAQTNTTITNEPAANNTQKHNEEESAAKTNKIIQDIIKKRALQNDQGFVSRYQGNTLGTARH